jgi:hypothetical protein
MHHHRLVLNGPPGPVADLARALRDAGAEPAPDDGPPRFTWTTPDASPPTTLCARHPGVAVGVERFVDRGATLDHLVLQGGEATVLERLPFAPTPDEDPPPSALGPDDCAPLPPEALAEAADRVAREPVRLPARPMATALDDALLVGAALGRVCAAVSADPGAVLPDDASPAALPALAALAAAACTAGAAAHDPSSPGELAYERARVLAEAHALAAGERLWSRRGDADWPEWLMYVLTGTATVLDDCAAAVHQPPLPVFAPHAGHGATLVERLGHATTRLVTTCLQTLVLFSAGTAAASGDCARN